MKIERIDTYVLKVSSRENAFYSSQDYFAERTSLLVRITCDDGTTGWGEGGQYGPPEPPASCIRDVIGPRLIGRYPAAPTAIFEEFYARTRDFGQKGAYVEALSAIDIALWDIFGKMVGQPVHALLGGAIRQRVRAYGTGCYYPPDYADRPVMLEKLREEVLRIRATGVAAVKMKIGLLPIRDDIERMRLVRETLGDDVEIMADANHAYNYASAVRIGRVMEELDFRWFEEPVVPEDREGYRRLRETLDVPIAGGEAEFTRFGFRDLIGGGCIDIAQPDICAAGGFTEWKNILALATSHNIMVVPHVWGSGVAVAAALQALAIVPHAPYTARPVPLQNETMIEFDRTYNPLRDDILTETFVLENECLAIPTGPGLGVTVDADAVRRHCVRHETIGAGD
ncbi:mandelate racemase/muconate lactonizing enzyme family protein [Aurantimonas sp. DM33-3]|uniref:mandelate racemase/muconate lactonizing enzyme family protein n=1 Tax=Aurantimonas sp. DM33-3 TaxID=2766955 RepID=UPI001652B3FE|nr:mandelate racemase/muconate lactonizing enzyme family protein [Aurantimonas sp. DM33-3]MBC6715486.1 mandelate racemase/muconate lactonizing enzyme family protein [Aurantimonas sp. DM33-3]